MKNLTKIVYLTGLLSLAGCPINSKPQPHVNLSANLEIYPERNVCFNVVDKSKEYDVVSCEAYLIERKTGIETKLNFSVSKSNLKGTGFSIAFWDIVSQFDELPEGECTFLLEMIDKAGKKGTYELPIKLKKKDKKN